jgi:hypothetical protein
MSINDDIRTLAFKGDWDRLLALLWTHPDLVNVASEPKGYTPLHQAAWHGADLTVIGQLLRLGASRRARTISKRQNAAEIAAEKHPDREDLAFVLAERRTTISQLMRKVIASNRGLFKAYDGNQILADRLIACFGTDPCPGSIEELDRRLDAAFVALTGQRLGPDTRIMIETCEGFDMEANGQFWTSRFLPLLRQSANKAEEVVLEKEWAAVADLFDPAPQTWGLRGDLFLWLEMRQALSLVPIPERPEDVSAIIGSASHALTGTVLEAGSEVFVSRYQRGGMSGGLLYGGFWVEDLAPSITMRAKWISEY